jgi:hypothetical protein
MVDSYTLDDFSTSEWMERPEYCEYQGISQSHLLFDLHKSHVAHLITPQGRAAEHMAFVHVERMGFTIWLYDVVSWDEQWSIRTLLPSFRIYGRTFEGVTEVQACPAVSPLPTSIVEQMEWVQSFVVKQGWSDEF